MYIRVKSYRNGLSQDLLFLRRVRYFQLSERFTAKAELLGTGSQFNLSRVSYIKSPYIKTLLELNGYGAEANSGDFLHALGPQTTNTSGIKASH